MSAAQVEHTLRFQHNQVINSTFTAAQNGLNAEDLSPAY